MKCLSARSLRQCLASLSGVWLRLAPRSLPWWSRGLVVRVLPLSTREHSRRTNKAVAVPLLQCWLDKSLSAGLLPLKRRSRASLLVNDLTHFLPLQSFHESLLWGCRCSIPAFLGSFTPHPPLFHTVLCTHCKQMEEKVSISKISPPFKQPSSLQNQHGINKFNMNWKLMKCEPPPLPPDCQPLGNTELLEIRRRGREWDHCHNYTIKSSSQQSHKTGPLSGGWPVRLATTCPAFFCDTALCHFPPQWHWGTGRIQGRSIHATVVIIPVYKSHSCKQAIKTFRRTHANDCTQIRLQCNPELLVSDYGRLCVK